MHKLCLKNQECLKKFALIAKTKKNAKIIKEIIKYDHFKCHLVISITLFCSKKSGKNITQKRIN